MLPVHTGTTQESAALSPLQAQDAVRNNIISRITDSEFSHLHCVGSRW